MADEETKKTRVAILGGGPAGLSAAFGLSATEELRAKYDVTIYQVGWRVGGKCASGREGPTKRIDENGTHYLFGAYRNAFGAMRTVFAELEAAGETRFGTFDDNFVPRSLLAIKQFFQGRWETWCLQLPTNFEAPGSSGPCPQPRDLLTMLIQGMVEVFCGWRTLAFLQQIGVFPKPLDQSLVGKLYTRVKGDVDQAIAYGGVKLLELALGLAKACGSNEDDCDGLAIVAYLVKCFRSWLWCALRHCVSTNLDAYRLWTTLDLGCTVVIGMIEDGALDPAGLAKLDAWDLRAWVKHHGASEETVWCEQLQTWYNAIAAYRNGDIATPDISAAVGLQSLMRLSLTYQGAFAYQMSCEVGDSVIAPYWQCLTNRGVKTAFFHRVWDVVPGTGPDENRIVRVTMEKQLTLKSGDIYSYQPFIQVKGRDVWPNHPLWGQIADADPKGPNTDSFYTTQRGPTVELLEGRDFDLLVYAMPAATIPFYATKLMERRKAWREMTKLRTVETQSLRCWWNRTLPEMGWDNGAPVLSSYVQPLATWEDNAQLIDHEVWPADERPKAISTVFGPLPCEPTSPGPEDTDYPKRQQAIGNVFMLKFLEFDVGGLWPGAVSRETKYGVDWNLLVSIDPSIVGPARFYTQQPRVNVGPTERYTQAGSDTLQYRLRTDETQFGNLFIAGDWIRNGMELGSVEGAIMGGLLASQAICGSPRDVPGSDGV
jgi:uncharacterized protein with NAD-binding domain and iron-sulfur cluster